MRIWGGLPGCEHEWGPLERGKRKDVLPLDKTAAKRIGFGEGTHDNAYIQGGNFCVKCGAWRGSLGLEPHPQLFIDHLAEICREIKRVLKPTGTFFLNLGDTYYGSGGKGGQYEKFMPKKGQPAHYRQSSKSRSNWLQPKQLLGIPWRVAIALQDDGWTLRSDIIWHKSNYMPSSVKDRLTNAYEHVFMFVKARRYYFDLDAIRVPQKTIMEKHEGASLYRDGHPSAWSANRRELNPKGKNPGDILSGSKYLEHDNPHSIRVKGGHTGDYTHPRGKNPGDLWRISTTPFPGAHFATFPPKLIEPIIKAGSPRWVCSKCGKPRERIIETDNPSKQLADDGIRGWSNLAGQKTSNPQSVKSLHRNISPDGKTKGVYYSGKTIDWSDCGCGEKWVGGIVLDPFGGSGTVGQVARKLGRRFILIEIIPEYCKIAEQRVRGKYKPIPEGIIPLTQSMKAEK